MKKYFKKQLLPHTQTPPSPLSNFGLHYLVEEMSPTPISEYCFFRRKVNYQVD